MSQSSLTGSDTIKINGRILTAFGDGDVANLEYPNDIATVKTGKDGNSVMAPNASGAQADLTLRLLRGSNDDKFMNGLLTQQTADFASMVLIDGLFVKRVGDGRGNVSQDAIVASAGVFSKNVAAKSNVEGDTDQSLAIYTLKFANAARVIA